MHALSCKQKLRTKQIIWTIEQLTHAWLKYSRRCAPIPRSPQHNVWIIAISTILHHLFHEASALQEAIWNHMESHTVLDFWKELKIDCSSNMRKKILHCPVPRSCHKARASVVDCATVPSKTAPVAMTPFGRILCGQTQQVGSTFWMHIKCLFVCNKCG